MPGSTFMTYWRGMYCASRHLQWDDSTKKLLYFTPRNHFLINSSHLAVGARTQCAYRRPKAKSSRLHITYLVEGVTTKYISFPYKFSRKSIIIAIEMQVMKVVMEFYGRNIVPPSPRQHFVPATFCPTFSHYAHIRDMPKMCPRYAPDMSMIFPR